jgi:hypothetical protein
MNNNRREFFKVLGSIAAGVVGAKISSYIPEKKKENEQLMVSEHITFFDKDGNKYNPVVVPLEEPNNPPEMNTSYSFSLIDSVKPQQVRKLS